MNNQDPEPIKRAHPFNAWVLTAGFTPKEVTCDRDYTSFGVTYQRSSAGRYFSPNELFESEAEAIAGGRARLAEQQAKLDASQARITKKAAALDKAEQLLRLKGAAPA